MRWLLLALFTAGCATGPAPAAAKAQRRQRASDALLEVLGRADPEGVTFLGLTGFEGRVRDVARSSELEAAELDALADRYASEARTEPSREGRVDLQILEAAARRYARRARVHDRLLAEVPPVSRVVFQGLSAGRRDERAAQYPKMIDAAIGVARRQLASGKQAPWVEEVKANLKKSRALDAESVQLAGPASAELGTALHRWETFLEVEVLPAARADFRPPREVYLVELAEQGIDVQPEALAAEARAAFEQTYATWRALADPPVAHLRELKAKQKSGQALLDALVGADAELEALIRERKLFTLPDRPLGFRLISGAEAALNPVPTIDVRGFMGGQKQIDVLVPPTAAFDDFSYEAAAWPLAVHEGRPGHELQLTHAAERGLSPTRTLWAFNTVNVEGWGLYAEEVMRGYLPRDARFVSTQFLLIREARAFLEPGLVLGTLTEADVREVLGKQLGCSDALVDSELRRYAFESRGQAPAYYVGLKKLEALRARVEQAQGAKFDAHRFHDAVLNQGFVPLDLLAAGVLEDLNIASSSGGSSR